MMILGGREGVILCAGRWSERSGVSCYRVEGQRVLTVGGYGFDRCLVQLEGGIFRIGGLFTRNEAEGGLPCHSVL